MATTTDDELDRRLSFAADLARRAGDLALRYFRDAGSLDVRLKGRQDLVTAADLAVDALIRATIAEAFPGDAILSEESGGGGAGPIWIVDPIDGTANFARGIAHFAISIGFCDAAGPAVGVVRDPAADETFSAARGGGAFLGAARLRVSAVTRPEDAMIDAGYSHRRPLAEYAALVARLLDAGFAFCQAGSSALALAHLAAGRIDGSCELLLSSWDVAAGLVLVAEAGGDPGSFFAAGVPTQDRPLVAAAPGIAAALKAASGIA